MIPQKKDKFPTQGQIILFIFNCARINLQDEHDSLRKRLLRLKEKEYNDSLLYEAEKVFREKLNSLLPFEEEPKPELITKWSELRWKKSLMPLLEQTVLEIVKAPVKNSGSFLNYCRKELYEKLAGRLEDVINRQWTGAFFNTYFPDEWFLPTIDEHNNVILPISKVIKHFEEKIFTESMSKKMVFKIFKKMNIMKFNLIRNWSRWRSGSYLPNFETLVSLIPDKPPEFYSVKNEWKSLPEDIKNRNIVDMLRKKGTPGYAIKKATNNWIQFLDNYYNNLGEFKIEHLIGAIFIARFTTAVYQKAVSRWGEKTAKELLSAFNGFYQKQKKAPINYPFSKQFMN